jgi:hypothetical protein
MQGTDFVERAVIGVGWGSYMERVTSFLNNYGPRKQLCEVHSESQSIRLNQSTMHDMLDYVMSSTTSATARPAKKRQKRSIARDKYLGERALWNLAYWITAGSDVPEYTRGWVTYPDGRTIRREGMACRDVSTIELKHV